MSIYETPLDFILLAPLPEWVRMIVREVAEKHGVPPREILSRSRTVQVTAARTEAIYRTKAARPMTSAPTIGKWFGLDHTSVLTALARYQARHGAPVLSRYKKGSTGRLAA
ncbi:MAG TPA: helix-turn-helix domain-containing protein [Rhizobiaceae bacterium]|nr:helix-turn-helix domain-containing protein [Rhizobiaceae bacterium]